MKTMKASDIKIGQRVVVATNGKTAIVVGRPEYWTREDVKLVNIKYEQSTRYEKLINSQLELLPTEDQFAEHGGTFERPEGLY